MAAVLALSPSERLQLIGDIWDTLADDPEALAITDEEREELDRRLHDYQSDPSTAIPWEEVRKRIERSL